MSFIADTGYQVLLNSFQLAGYGSWADQPLAILDGAGGVITDYGPVAVPGSGHIATSPGITGQVLRIRFGNTNNVGIGNINFDEVGSGVPEPSAFLLIASAAVPLAFRLRRRG